MASSFQDLEIPAKEPLSITTIHNKQMTSKTGVANTSEPRRKNSRDTFHESSWLFRRDAYNNPHITSPTYQKQQKGPLFSGCSSGQRDMYDLSHIDSARSSSQTQTSHPDVFHRHRWGVSGVSGGFLGLKCVFLGVHPATFARKTKNTNKEKI